MSLRGRLLVAIAALITLGLLAADIATFAFLRTNLISRVDQQLRSSAGEAYNHLREISAGLGDHGYGHGRGPASTPGFGATYAEIIDSGGKVVVGDSLSNAYEFPRPELPAGFTTSLLASRSTVSFSSGAVSSSLHYRVLASAATDGSGALIVAYPLSDIDATLRHLLIVEGLVTGGVVAAAVLVALWLVRLGMRPLAQMEHTADAIAGGELSKRIEHDDPRTEVGRLGRALNVMLERIEQAFTQRRASEDRLRRFIADASHELRTPLTSIRGYAELFRHGADSRPDDLRKTMRRIEEESTRMGTLVDELLLLARLDQGRPLERGAVDLSRIIDDAAADARAIDPDRPIDARTTGPVLVSGDDARLRQVVANLVSNALAHTPAGTPVHVRLHVAANDAIVEVSDEGPGLTSEDSARVFDRFFRVDAARVRGVDHSVGSGLGLSIVAAITHAHNGRVWVQSEPGKGASFFVALPLPTPAEAAQESKTQPA